MQNASYSCYGAILGAWLDGIAGNIGIQAENWYWNDAGFCDDIGQYHGYLQGNEQQIPAVFLLNVVNWIITRCMLLFDGRRGMADPDERN